MLTKAMIAGAILWVLIIWGCVELYQLVAGWLA